ncbi:Late embryogenesis abundant protein, LEA-18 [Corchorus olitorius]|uniref:Late embryogenesis abundant protein, LEA-18 n=1 Tax=Corchorus olitorius TaxID=93759 RepID=A0A1R3JBS9_9ROSI|nr:Late embryogenesis abundant protein, LEA-18 [Corchorus olitorius]
MSNSAKEQRSQEGESQWQKKDVLEGLPLESSPYLKYHDLEDYKRQAYGTEGHLQVQEKRGAGASTDAPTLSASGTTLPETKNATTN